MIDKIKALAGSKRFWAGALAALLVYANSQLKLVSDIQAASIATIITGWIVGETFRPSDQK